MEVTLKNERWYRVMVGPYKESEVSLAQSDLKAKGYKDVIIQK
jgi:cell division protein FtsN